jgi:hypothetical protein
MDSVFLRILRLLCRPKGSNNVFIPKLMFVVKTPKKVVLVDWSVHGEPREIQLASCKVLKPQ